MAGLAPGHRQLVALPPQSEDGTLRRIPQRIANELPFGHDAIPEYAGTRQRIAFVILELVESKPARILDARGEHWTFDDQGRVDADMTERLRERLDLLPGASGTETGSVVDLVPELKRRALDARDRWTLTADDLDRIAADLWPGARGPAPEVTSVKGKAPRKPPLTYEARDALRRLNDHVNGIKSALSMLNERALKGLVFEATRTGMWEDETLWRGIADEAKRLEAIRAAHRTGRGEWYAVVEVARASRDYAYLFEEVAVAHARCSSRKEAIEAGRKLMAEKVDWGSGPTWRSASTCDLRWNGGQRSWTRRHRVRSRMSH